VPVVEEGLQIGRGGRGARLAPGTKSRLQIRKPGNRERVRRRID
jgi:hypothetical protein